MKGELKIIQRGALCGLRTLYNPWTPIKEDYIACRFKLTSEKYGFSARKGSEIAYFPEVEGEAAGYVTEYKPAAIPERAVKIFAAIADGSIIGCHKSFARFANRALSGKKADMSLLNDSIAPEFQKDCWAAVAYTGAVSIRFDWQKLKIKPVVVVDGETGLLSAGIVHSDTPTHKIGDIAAAAVLPAFERERAKYTKKMQWFAFDGAPMRVGWNPEYPNKVFFMAEHGWDIIPECHHAVVLSPGVFAMHKSSVSALCKNLKSGDFYVYSPAGESMVNITERARDAGYTRPIYKWWWHKVSRGEGLRMIATLNTSDKEWQWGTPYSYERSKEDTRLKNAISKLGVPVWQSYFAEQTQSR